MSMAVAVAQNKQVSGTVIDDSGEPVVGASVIAKGNAALGTVTDVDGKFSLSVPESVTKLTVKYLGMQEQEVTAASNITVILRSAESSLDEVIVVAYGTAKRSSFTGSASVIKAGKLADRSVSNVTNALSGQTAGVQVSNTNGGQPGTAATIRIRGIGSMSASNSPLYVIDGVPFDGNLSSINSNDIETISVLKDAAANAIYGHRGANGVVLITTKKGKPGEAQVTVEGRWGSNSRAVPNYAVMTDPAMYYETFYKALYNSRAYNGASAADAYAFADKALLDPKQGGLGYLVYTVPDGEKLIGTNFKLNPKATLGYSDGDFYYTPDNWYNETFNKGNLRQSYDVTISGSNEKLNYYLSAGYLEDSGIIPSSGFTRFSGLTKADYQAKKWLKVGANVGITSYNIKAPTSQTTWGSSGNLFYITNQIAPIYPLYVRNPDGSIKVDSRGNTVYDFGGASTNFTRPFLSNSNPAGSLSLDDYNTLTDVVISKWYAILTPMEGLTLTANMGANVINQRYNYLYNQFYGNSVSSEGLAVVEHDRDFDIDQQYLADYTKKIDKHNIDILAGYESYSRKMQQLGGNRQNLYNPFVGELSNGIQWPPSDMYSSTDYYATEGILSRLQYDYDGKYFLSGSYRRDASSRFHQDKRWGNFGSGSLAWLISKEDFLNTVDWIETLKLKASYGIQGNDRILDRSGYDNYYPYLDQYKITNDGTGGYSLVTSYIGNKDITWETSSSFNTGIDFELFKNRLNGTIEYFNRKTVDLLYYQPQPLTSGFEFKPFNVGSVSNGGIEIDLNGTVFKNNNIEWTMYANATHVKNKILDLIETSKKLGGIKGSNYIYKVGSSLYTLYMVKFAGVDQETGKALYYVDPDKGDMSTTDDFTKAKQADLGETLPYWYGGFGTDIKAYGFDLSVQLAYQTGGKLYDGSYAALMHSGMGSTAGTNWHKDILKSWTPENPSATIPRLAASDDSYQIQSSRFVTSSDFLSLNNVTFGYTFPKKWVEKAQMSSLRLYVTSDNVALLTARQGLDPRTSIGLGSSTTSGNFRYSALRSISGGISIKF